MKQFNPFPDVSSQYGDKRDYAKIDIYWRGTYKASTTWAKTCREAKERFLMIHTTLIPSEIKCRFAK